MKKVFALALTALAAAVSTAAVSGCFMVLIDEPEMPESLQ